MSNSHENNKLYNISRTFCTKTITESQELPCMSSLVLLPFCLWQSQQLEMIYYSRFDQWRTYRRQLSTGFSHELRCHVSTGPIIVLAHWWKGPTAATPISLSLYMSLLMLLHTYITLSLSLSLWVLWFCASGFILFYLFMFQLFFHTTFMVKVTAHFYCKGVTEQWPLWPEWPDHTDKQHPPHQATPLPEWQRRTALLFNVVLFT